MTFTAQQIAEFLGGKVDGNPNVKVSDFAPIEAGKPGSLSFLANPKYTSRVYSTKADIVLVNDSFVPEQPLNCTLIRVSDAYSALARLMQLAESSQTRKTGISSLSNIHESVMLGKDIFVDAFVIIAENSKIGESTTVHGHCHIAENVTIGKNCILYPGVTIYKNSIIGDNCILHAGVVIGSDGFGFAPDEKGVYNKIPQIGNVVVEDNVEIGANTTIDRATLGSTVISKGVKLDNLVQIAHNVEIGSNTVIAAQTGISGSSKVGENCMFGGQVGLAGHIQIANRTIIAAQAGVPGNIKEEGKVWQGTPIMPLRNFYRSSASLKNLPELEKLVHDLKRKVESLENELQKQMPKTN